MPWISGGFRHLIGAVAGRDGSAGIRKRQWAGGNSQKKRSTSLPFPATSPADSFRAGAGRPQDQGGRFGADDAPRRGGAWRQGSRVGRRPESAQLGARRDADPPRRWRRDSEGEAETRPWPASESRGHRGLQGSEVVGGVFIDQEGGADYGYQDVEADLLAMDEKVRRGGRGGGRGRRGRQGSGAPQAGSDWVARRKQGPAASSSRAGNSR